MVIEMKKAKEKLKQVGSDIVNIGVKPIQSSDILFPMLVAIGLSDGHAIDYIKCPAAMGIKRGSRIDSAMGATIKSWLSAPAATPPEWQKWTAEQWREWELDFFTAFDAAKDASAVNEVFLAKMNGKKGFIESTNKALYERITAAGAKRKARILEEQAATSQEEVPA